ncbi:MAG: substrate-binding protein [Solirubrobacterales bacterium]|nr:substrate-binding protein [Solirubrobacterales bacterium]
MRRPNQIRAAARYPLAAFVLAVALAALAGCGSSGSSSTAAAGKQGSQSSAERGKATASGEAAAVKDGPAVSLGKQTVGLIQDTSEAESIQRETQALEAAAGVLGWHVDVCDGQGETAKMASCATTLLNENVTIMVVANVEAAPVQAQMREAKSRGIPWINIGGASAPSPLFTTQVVENETEIGALMAKYVVERTGGKGTVATTEYPAIYALKLRMESLYKTLASYPGIKIVSRHTIDFSNLVADVRGWANSVLTKNPNLSVFALCVDTDPVAVAPVVQSRDHGKQYPERPLIVGSLGDLANLELIRKGEADAVAETALGSTAWIALDQAAEYFARHKPFSPEPQNAYGLAILKPHIVDKENVPANSKQYAEPPVDFEAYFKAKWKKEFTAS